MEKRIAEYASSVIIGFYDKVTEEEIKTILTIDLPSIIREFNKGNIEVLDSKEVQAFISSKLTVKDIISYLRECEVLLSYKKDILALVERQKSDFSYNPNARFFHQETYSFRDHNITYEQVLNALKTAEQVLNTKQIYVLLRVLLKYESIRSELGERKQVFDSLKEKDERRDLLEETIDRGDSSLGIVQIFESNKNPRIVAGSKKDMAISEIIGVPFPAEADREGYEYGPHGDYYKPAYKCQKVFHQPETQTHLDMIRKEAQKRQAVSNEIVDEKGYIYQNGVALLITRKELAECGVNPESVGWKPIKVTPKRQSVLTLCDIYGNRLSLRKQFSIKAKTL